ncbi:MAG: hypothetical protein WC895_04270 [Candidatus Shapirobacteria bacterium]|jgi:hypothetical protein
MGTTLLAIGGSLLLKASPRGWLSNCPYFSWGRPSLDTSIQVYVLPPGKRTLSDFECEIEGTTIRSVDPGPGHAVISFTVVDNVISILPATDAMGVSISTVADIVDAINTERWTLLGFPAQHGLGACLGNCAGAAIFTAADALLATIVPGGGFLPIVDVGGEICTIDWTADIDADGKPDAVVADKIYPTYVGGSLPAPGTALVGVTVRDGTGATQAYMLPVA